MHGAWQRASASLLFRRPLAIESQTPLISFTFDDFPRSALLTGGAILNGFGLAGTYYTSFGLMGTQAPTGMIFERDDLKTLVGQGHELGCHTFAHCHSWDTEPAAFEESIAANRQALNELVPGASFRTFSYPVSPPRPTTKKNTSKHFVGCRGGGQIFNAGTADLNYLSAYFLEKSCGNREVVKHLIGENRLARGWLILATHDVCESPTRFGCTPDFFEDIVQSAVASGARILPVADALEVLR